MQTRWTFKATSLLLTALAVSALGCGAPSAGDEEDLSIGESRLTDNGINNGFNNGLNNGINNGFNNGINNGLNNGINNGFNVGFTPGAGDIPLLQGGAALLRAFKVTKSGSNLNLQIPWTLADMG